MRVERVRVLDTAGWHSRVARVYRYWLSIHPPAGLPGRRHFDPVAIPDLLPGIWLLDVQRRPFRLRYRLVGTGIVEALGREVTGQWLDEAHPHLHGETAFWERYRRAVEQAQAEWRKGKPRIWTHRDFGEIENVLLPLAADGANVDMLIAYTLLYRPDGMIA
jgi:hypothetical protein